MEQLQQDEKSEMQVRKEKVDNALFALKENHPAYKGIEIDIRGLDWINGDVGEIDF